MKRALLIIDFTNDFVAPEGALSCGEPGQAITAEIVRLAEEFQTRGDFVILPTDLHQENDPYHPETALFPPHNLAGTWGREFVEPLAKWFQANQGAANVLKMDKNRYSAFANTNLENYLRERKITEIHLVGVCTDICVLHTAVDGYNKNFPLVIHQDAVASFNPVGHEWALEHFQKSLGATVI